MDHFSAPGRPQDMRDIARIAATDALRMQRIIGNEPPPDLGPALVADGDAVAARKHPFDPCNPSRQQAFAAGERRHSASIDNNRSFKFQQPADPDIARRDRVRWSGTRCSRRCRRSVRSNAEFARQ